MGLNDSRGVIQCWDGTTPGVSFCHGIERDYRGVIQSYDGTTTGEIIQS